MAAATATKRFSKQTMIDFIQAEISRLERQWNFTSQTGWVQVKGEGETANQAYGQYAAYCDMLTAIENGTF